MSGPRKTCDKCKHFTPDDTYSNLGECAQTGDMNEQSFDYKTRRKGEDNKAYGWDRESYEAGVLVGRKFGCIHWEKAQ